jgi:glutathione S-transferase
VKLHDFPFSPRSRKVRAVAYDLGIALETQRIDVLTGGQRAPEFLARNPASCSPR